MSLFYSIPQPTHWPGQHIILKDPSSEQHYLINTDIFRLENAWGELPNLKISLPEEDRPLRVLRDDLLNAGLSVGFHSIAGKWWPASVDLVRLKPLGYWAAASRELRRDLKALGNPFKWNFSKGRDRCR